MKNCKHRECDAKKNLWIPVRILAYTALLWLDRFNNKLVTSIVILSGSENPRADSPYQPNYLALLVDEKTITDEILNKNSDFYALYLELKRAKTPMAMHEAINK